LITRSDETDNFNVSKLGLSANSLFPGEFQSVFQWVDPRTIPGGGGVLEG
jgi:hypothetical protein